MPETINISVLGDSQMVRLVAAWPQSTVRREGHYRDVVRSGIKTAELKRVVRTSLQHLADTCVALVGINDILQGIPLDSIKRNIINLVKLVAKSRRKILVSTLPPTLHRDNKHINQIIELNVFIQSLASAKNVKVFQFHRLFPPFAVFQKQMYQLRYRDGRPDLVHLSTYGLKCFARGVLSIYKTLYTSAL